MFLTTCKSVPKNVDIRPLKYSRNTECIVRFPLGAFHCEIIFTDYWDERTNG